MQCVNCQFENMPGLSHCGRCGASLQLGTTEIDVHPPRANVWSRWRRRWLPIYQPMERTWDCLEGWLKLLGDEWDQTDYSTPRLWRLILPGWAQIHHGARQRGRCFLLSFLMFSILACVYTGTVWGSFFCGLAIAVHVSSILDVMMAGLSGWAARILWTSTAVLLVACVVYWPVLAMILQIACPLVLQADVEPFQRGDVLIYNPSAYGDSFPNPGDIVVYLIPRVALHGNAPHGATVYDIVGWRIDRVLAGPGQHAVWDGETLHVDGNTIPWKPLNPRNAPHSLNVLVPDGHCLILPTTDQAVADNATLSEWKTISTVPRANLVGRVLFRSQPFSRFGRID